VAISSISYLNVNLNLNFFKLLAISR